MPLHLVQPPSGGLRSGGYAYNEQIGRRLAARGLGALREVKRADLADQGFPEGSRVLIDSLFLSRPLSAAEGRALAAMPARYFLLLHLLPFDDPSAPSESRKQFRASVERWLPHLSGVVVTGHGAAREWSHHFSNSFEPVVAPPAIRGLPRAPRSDGRPRRLLTIGGLCPRKNQGAILRALQRAAATNWRWDVVGQVDKGTPYARAFLEELQSLKGGDRVHLHGSLSQKSCDRFIAEADLFITASRFESFGIATATALASGVPTLSYRVGDIGQWCGHGEGSWVYAPQDPLAFESQLLDLLHRDGPLPGPEAVEVPCVSWDDTLSRLLAVGR